MKLRHPVHFLLTLHLTYTRTHKSVICQPLEFYVNHEYTHTHIVDGESVVLVCAGWGWGANACVHRADQLKKNRQALIGLSD